MQPMQKSIDHMLASNDGTADQMLLVLFDVDGTLSNSHDLCLDATNHVLVEAGYAAVSSHDYQLGTIYSTPARMAWHATGEAVGSSHVGVSLGQRFDEFYVTLVTATTAPLYDGIRYILESLAITIQPPLGILPSSSTNNILENTLVAEQANAELMVPAVAVAAMSSETADDTKLATPLATDQYEAPCKMVVGALTNAAQAYAVAVLRVNDLSEMFTVVHGADSVPMPKPSPLGVQQCAQEVGVPESRVLYVGDSPTDGAAARACGAHGVGVSWGYHPSSNLESEFDVVVHTPEALHAEIKRWAAQITC
jgi:HAD superfamily hydrolase (TIGR01509 family)